jgi:hypothetical protein
MSGAAGLRSLKADASAKVIERVGKHGVDVGSPGNGPREIVVPLAHHLHPEFGWFCPPASLRRTGRMSLRALVCLAIVGVLALRAGRGPSVDGALTVAHGDPARPLAATIETDGQAASAERPGASELGKGACESDSWSFSPGKCNAGTTRRVQAPRSANEAPVIAALPLGRSTPLEAASSAGSVDLTDVDLTDISNSPLPTPALVAPLNVRAPPPKKIRSQSHVQSNDRDFIRDRRWRDDRWTARGYAWPGDRYARDRYSGSWGSW